MFQPLSVLFQFGPSKTACTSSKCQFVVLCSRLNHPQSLVLAVFTLRSLSFCPSQPAAHFKYSSEFRPHPRSRHVTGGIMFWLQLLGIVFFFFSFFRCKKKSKNQYSCKPFFFSKSISTTQFFIFSPKSLFLSQEIQILSTIYLKISDFLSFQGKNP